MDWLMHRRVERQAIRMHEMLAAAFDDSDQTGPSIAQDFIFTVLFPRPGRMNGRKCASYSSEVSLFV